MHTKGMSLLLVLVCFGIGIIDEVLGSQEETPLRCDPSDPICQKFKHMLRQQQQSFYKSGQDADDLPCDPSDPICQKFQQMLSEQTDDDNSTPGRTSANIGRENSQDAQDLTNRGGSGSQGQGSQNNTCVPYICMLVGKTCWVNGQCGDLVAEELQGV